MIVAVLGWTIPAGADYTDGYLLYKQGNYEGAVTALTEVLAGQPDHEDGHYLLGLCYHKLGRYEEAKAALQGVVEKNPEHAKAQTNLARVLMKLKAYNPALEAAKKGVELLGDSSAYNVLGLAYLGLEQYDEADQAFGKAIEKDPRNPWPYNNRGYALILKGKDAPAEYASEALKMFDKALELNPENDLFKRNREFVVGVMP